MPVPKDMSGASFPSSRQARLYSFRVSLYAPADISRISVPGDLDDIQASDVTYEPQPRFVNVPAKYVPTPEYGRVEELGLTKEDSVLVSDKWRFFDTQEIADGWLVVMTDCRVPNALVGRCWVVQGNSTLSSSSARRPVHTQWVFAKLSPTEIIPAVGA